MKSSPESGSRSPSHLLWRGEQKAKAGPGVWTSPLCPQHWRARGLPHAPVADTGPPRRHLLGLWRREPRLLRQDAPCRQEVRLIPQHSGAPAVCQGPGVGHGGEQGARSCYLALGREAGV